MSSTPVSLLPLRSVRLHFGFLVLAVAALLLPGEAWATCTPSGNVTTCTSSGTLTVTSTYGDGVDTTAAVSGLSGTVSAISVTLNGLNIANFNSVSIALVPPTGTAFDLLGGVCNTGSATFTLADTGDNGTDNVDGLPPTEGGTCPSSLSGTYLAADYYANYQTEYFNMGGSTGPSTFNTAGPGNSTCESEYEITCGSYSFATAFGLPAGASAFNGTWKLYIASQNTEGSFANPSGTLTSWSISFTTVSAAATATSISANPNGSTSNVFTTGDVNGDSLAGTSVTLTATVTSGGEPVTSGGTVTFYDSTGTTAGNGTNLGSNSVNGSGVAAVAVTFPRTEEGSRSISAVYSGDASDAGSTSGFATVVTVNHTYSPSTDTYCNGPVTVEDDNGGAASGTGGYPYPSQLVLSGLTGTIQDLTVSINGMQVQDPKELGLLLQAPSNGNAFEFMSWVDGDGGYGNNPATLTNLNLTLSDTGSGNLRDDSVNDNNSVDCSSAPCLSTDEFPEFNQSFDDDTFPAPAPSSITRAYPAGNGTFANQFGGAGPNGNWALYLNNWASMNPSNNGSIPYGQINEWCVNLTLQANAHPTQTVASATPNPATITPPATTTSVSLTATVTTTDGMGLEVNAGSVTFVDGATTLGTSNVSSTGVATLGASLGEGTHQIVATYNGTDMGTEFGISTGKYDERVNTATTQATGSGAGPYTYCNPGAVTVPGLNYNSGAAAPYPSNIFVTNLPGTVNTVTVALDSLDTPDENDLLSLLVGPGNTNLDFFSETGTVGAFASSPVNLIFADSASSQVTADPVASGTYKPTSHNTSFVYPECPQNVTDCGTEDVGPPLLATTPNKAAPTGSSSLDSIFGGINGNGTWSLYLDDGGPNGGGEVSTLAKWCVNLTQNLPAVTVTKSHTGNFQQGEQGAQFTVDITNNGTGPTGDPTGGSNPLTVTDTLNTAFSYAGYSGTGWSCSAVGQTVTCTNDSAVAQSSSYSPLTIEVNVSPTANTASPASNQVSVTGGGVTPTSSNTDSVTIEPAPALAVSKTHTGTFTQGQTAEWDITVSNTAPSGSITMGATTVSDTLPSGYTLNNYGGTGWTCSGGGTANVSCTSSQGVSGGASYNTLTLTVDVPAASPISVQNTASAYGGGDVTHTNPGSAVASNTDTVTVVQVPATIAIDGTQTQSTPIGSAFGSLAVTVKDANSAVIANYSSVTFTASTASSGATGTFSNSTGTITLNTNGSGVADPGAFTANLDSGSYTVGVTAGSATATFNLTNTAITPTINWTPATTIIFGSAGTNVLNASPSCGMSCGTMTYTATPGGGSPTAIASTTTLVAGSYTITATFNPSSNGYNTNSATSPLTVSGESVWIVDGGGGTSELAGNGYGISSSAYPGASLAVAIDNAGNVWSVGAGPLLEETSQVGSHANPISSGGGIDAPAGIAIDGNGQVWVTDGNNAVSLFSNAGSAISPAGGIMDPSVLSTPKGIAVDLGGSVWIANTGNSSVTRILGAAAPVAPLATAAAGGTTGAKP